MNDNMSASIANLAMSLSKFQSEIANVDKDSQGYGYKYANLSGCIEAIKAPLAKYGLSVIQPMRLIDDKHILDTYIIHETGEWIKSSFPIEAAVVKGANAIQQLGAGITYTRRYALCALVGLAQEDTDGVIDKKNAESSKTQTAVKEQKPATKVLSIPATQLLDLCKENRIGAGEFCKHYNITSSDSNALQHAVENFDEMVSLYMLAKQNAVHTKTDALIQEMAAV